MPPPLISALRKENDRKHLMIMLMNINIDEWGGVDFCVFDLLTQFYFHDCICCVTSQIVSKKFTKSVKKAKNSHFFSKFINVKL